MTIGVIGAGYVGLATSLLCATRGHKVICTDINPDRIDRLRKGDSGFSETGLNELIKTRIDDGSLTFSENNYDGIDKSDAIFICVQTNDRANKTTLNVFKQVFFQIAYRLMHIKRTDVVLVQKSTIPVGTSETLLSAKVNENIVYVSNPEFLREGFLIEDTFNPSRVVVGLDEDVDGRANLAKTLFASLYPDHPPIYMRIKSAEVAKQAANAFLATKITYANIIQSICTQVGADENDVLRSAGLDPRIGNAFLKPGLGFGGSCLPKDLEGFIKVVAKHNLTYEEKFLQFIFDYNDYLPGRHAKQIISILQQYCYQANHAMYRIVVLGKTFKPCTNDTRNSPSLHLISHLKKATSDYSVYAYDPSIDAGGLSLDKSKDADMIVIATDWQEFKSLDWEELGKAVRTRLIFDCRNLFSQEDIIRANKAGFIYIKYSDAKVFKRRVGRPSANSL